MPRRLDFTGVILATALVCAFTTQVATAASPALSIVQPRGGQRGTEIVLTFSGARLADAQEIFFYSPGFQTTKIEPVNANSFKAHVKIAPNCRLGEHVVQVRTASGISEYRSFYVGPYPAYQEKEPNSEFETPQEVPFNVTVTGVVQNEDVDYYVVTAKKGQRISAEVEGMRLGTYLFDPYVAILDAKRFELSTADDTPLVWQDAVASVVAPADGKYIIEVRESAYGGNGNCRYRLHIGTFPRPTGVYPAGGKVGEEIEVTFIGDPTGDFKQRFKLPSQIIKDYNVEPNTDGKVAPSGNPFRLFAYGNSLEKEPNNALAEATPAQLPNAFNGIISQADDIDFFKFQAKKGQVFDVECYARRIRSALDPVMAVYNAKGGRIAANDDSRGPDSYFRFSVPADGEYLLSVTDHLKRGDQDYVYRVEFTPLQPKLTLGIPRVARYSQSRQTIFVARGNRFASLISVSRANFSGEIALDGSNLPKGITIHAEPMVANLNVMPVVFEAAADAPLSGKLIDFRGKLVDKTKKVEGTFHNSADFIRGGPGQSIYWRRTVDKLAVAVVEELPFTLEIVQPKVPLVRRGSMQLKIVAHRKKGFDEQINIQFPFRPPGVSGASSVNIPKGKSEILYPLNANANAQIKKWRVYVLGSANVKGTAWVSSQLATLEVAEPYIQFAMERSAVEQGKETQIFCKIEQKTPFEGAAKVRLLGLPNKVVAIEMEFTKDAKELVFKVTTDKISPAGRHKSVFCQVIITQNGESIVHSVGGTELRIDKPLPPKKNEPPKPAPKKVVAKKTPAKKVAPPKKPLSRLEQLRLEAKKKAAAATAAGAATK